MILRSKGIDYPVQNRAGLVEFLRGEMGLGNEEGGIRDVCSDVECIAAVPFCVAADTEKTDKGVPSEGIDWVFSTFDLDRYDERIDPAGWDFKRFLENPVVQWAHCSGIPAIGRAVGVFADDKGLHGSIVFNDKEYDPFGWGIGQRVKAGVIRAGSVGFRILEVELPSKENGKDGTALIFRKQELLEFSVCNVPANPFALAKEAKAVTESKQAAGLSSFWGNIIKEMKHEE